jgi:DNA gyrase/topoisomerase IV subunit A
MQYHPHGDASIDAMVQIGQNYWSIVKETGVTYY